MEDKSNKKVVKRSRLDELMNIYMKRAIITSLIVGAILWYFLGWLTGILTIIFVFLGQCKLYDDKLYRIETTYEVIEDTNEDFTI